MAQQFHIRPGSTVLRVPTVVHLAQRIGLVNRALTWHRVIASLPESLKSEYAMAAPAYLQEFVNTE
jgi:hypothetical protein